jgi:hypothetical protein
MTQNAHVALFICSCVNKASNVKAKARGGKAMQGLKAKAKNVGLKAKD